MAYGRRIKHNENKSVRYMVFITLHIIRLYNYTHMYVDRQQLTIMNKDFET